MTQKFFKGDLVQVGEMPPMMRYFQGNCKAIVLYTYTEQYGRSGANPDKDYSLFILKSGERGEVSWYHEDQLTLIEPDRFDLLPAGNVHRKAWEAKKQRDEADAIQTQPNT
jgi:hypothetical protein